MKANKVDQHFRLSFRFPLSTSILRLMIIVLFLSHLCGCGFHFVGEYSNLHSEKFYNGDSIGFRSWIEK